MSPGLNFFILSFVFLYWAQVGTDDRVFILHVDENSPAVQFVELLERKTMLSFIFADVSSNHITC